MMGRVEEMTEEELKKELASVEECLRDEEETFSFMFKSSQHMGGGQVRAMQAEHDERLNEYRVRIRQVEEMLKRRAHGERV